MVLTPADLPPDLWIYIPQSLSSLILLLFSPVNLYCARYTELIGFTSDSCREGPEIISPGCVGQLCRPRRHVPPPYRKKKFESSIYVSINEKTTRVIGFILLHSVCIQYIVSECRIMLLTMGRQRYCRCR